MKQEVTLKNLYPSSHQQLYIHAVYEKDNQLIVISQIVSNPKTSGNYIVNTTANKKLPVRTVIITDHYQPHTIPEIQGLTPLPVCVDSLAQVGIFSNSEFNSIESKDNPSPIPQP